MTSKAASTLTSGELAKLLDIGVSTIHDNIAAGFFTEPARTPRGHRRFNIDVVLRDYRVAGREEPKALVEYKTKLTKASRKVGRFAGATS